MKSKLPWILFSALILGLIMRTFQARERFYYAHDNDLSGWIVKDILIDRHLRLIGQETSARGIFIGPLFYYLLIPFYLFTRLDPIGILGFSWLVGLSGIAGLYFVANKLYGHRSAGIASLLYASSELISTTEREVVPTTAVMLWSVWAFYAVNRIFSGQKSGLLLAAVLFGLVWNINLALILLLPIFILGVIFNRHKFKLADFVIPSGVFFLLSSPLILFEFRHGFIQTRALIQSLFGHAATAMSFPAKMNHVLTYALKNATKLFFIPVSDFSYSLIPAILTILFILLLFTKKIKTYTGIIFILWMGLHFLFFTLHPINLSEYYLNGMNLFWIIIAAVSLGKLFPKIISSLILCLLISYNLASFLSSPVNAMGYPYKKALVEFIKTDAQNHNYPCISVSYITTPGNNFGYRYFFFLVDLSVNPPSSGSPVYSIVFPHSLVSRLDRTFGALGLVLPDYSRYDQKQVQLSCAGPNQNLTEPMFGFTK